VFDEIDKPVLDASRNLYRENEYARVLFDRLARRKTAAEETDVEEIARITKAPKEELQELIEGLAESGCGMFVLGRRGYNTRIIWNFNSAYLGRAAASAPDSDETAEVRANAIEAATRDYEQQIAKILQLPQNLIAAQFTVSRKQKV